MAGGLKESPPARDTEDMQPEISNTETNRDDVDLPSIQDTIIAQMVVANTNQTSTEAPSSRNANSNNAASLEERSWTNRCALCNGHPASHHSLTDCCLVCRNYSFVDYIAELWKLDKILALQASGRTFKNLLQDDDRKFRALQKEEKQHLTMLQSRLTKANSLVDPRNEANHRSNEAAAKYNEIIKVNPYVSPASEAAQAEYDAAHAKFKDIDGSCLAARASFEEAKKDHASKRAAIDGRTKARALVIVRIAERLFYLARIPTDDNVGKARVFYSWVAKSLRYDLDARSLLNAEDRNPTTTIINQYEVCKGFAELFNAMYNYDLDPMNRGLSAYVSGHIRQHREHTTTENNSHAWNAFPLGNGTWKLIDATGAAGAASDKKSTTSFNPAWFTKCNEEFLLTHIPHNEDYQFRDENEPPIDTKLFWNVDRVECLPASAHYHINQASIIPSGRVIQFASPSPIVFEFKKTCIHYTGVHCSFVIWTGTTNEEGQANAIDIKDLIFVQLPEDYSGWRAFVSIPETANAAILYALLINNEPAKVESLDEWKEMKDGVYRTIAKWELEFTA